MRDSLQGCAQVYYAVKANPSLALLRALQGQADGVDISSAGELVQAQLAGFDGGCMSFAGPAKAATELEAAIRAGVACISMESIREIDECARVAQRIGTRARVMLRVNPLLASSYGLKMGGNPVQFGLDEEELPAAEARVQELACLEFRGIHVYVGSQCFEPAGWHRRGYSQRASHRARGGAVVEQRSGLRCVKVNLCGGLAMSHGEERRELDLDALSTVLVPVLSAYRKRGLCVQRPCRFWGELRV